MRAEPRRCAVLGGAGFLGSHLTEALLARGHSVRVFDKTGTDLGNLAQVDGPWEFCGGDFVNEVDQIQAVAGMDVVYHLVSTTIPATSNRNPVYDVESNLAGTLKLLQHARESGVERVVFISSGGTVYGKPERLPIPEDHPTQPMVSYGIVKRAIEHYLDLFHRVHGLSYTIARLSNPYGPRQDARGALGAASVFLARTWAHEPIEIWGDGSVVRDYVYVTDAVEGILAAVEKGGDAGIYNIGSGKGASLTELVALIARVSRRRPEVFHKPSRAFDVPENVLDVSKARRDLGWEPRVGLEEGLSLTWSWLEEHAGGVRGRGRDDA